MKPIVAYYRVSTQKQAPSAHHPRGVRTEKGVHPRSPPPRPYLLDHHSAALLSADRALDRARGRCRAMSAALELGNRA